MPERRYFFDRAALDHLLRELTAAQNLVAKDAFAGSDRTQRVMASVFSVACVLVHVHALMVAGAHGVLSLDDPVWDAPAGFASFPMEPEETDEVIARMLRFVENLDDVGRVYIPEPDRTQ